MGSITSLFPSQVIVDVLCVFFTHEHLNFYQRNLAKRTGHSLAQVQYALQRIVESGLIKKWSDGNRIYYTADIKHPAFKDLKRAFQKTVALGDFFKDVLDIFNHDQIKAAFIFGSIAKGEEKAESDIDLFILGNVSTKEIAFSIDELSKSMEREVSPILYTEQKFKQHLQNNNRFAQELINTPKIWIIGNEDEFRKLAG